MKRILMIAIAFDADVKYFSRTQTTTSVRRLIKIVNQSQHALGD